jgi:NTE family protein
MPTTRKINLALQGGGAHGAFTWGVLDRLLEDESIEFEAISGTSAGAMNAVVVADGLHRGGRAAARERLHEFWRAVSRASLASPVQRSFIDVLMGSYNLDHNPAVLMFEALQRVASPYALNPLNLNPLRDILEETVDFDNVCACDRMKVFVSATNVRTGRVQVFPPHELRPEMVMASACLPQLFQAVEIEGVPYWDGGFMGNPVLFPFFEHCESRDIVIVQINPVERPETPRSAREILNRVNEITFNSSLLRELRAIDFVQRLIEAGRLEDTHYRRLFVHRIDPDDEMLTLGASSKLNAEWRFLRHLFEIGRRCAENWLARHAGDLGLRSSVDLREMFDGPDARPLPRGP